MTDQTPEPVEAIGDPLSVRMEGSVTDGVFRMDFGIEENVLLTLHFNQDGLHYVATLLEAVRDQYPAIYEQILAAVDAEVEAEEPAAPVENADAFPPAEPSPPVEDAEIVEPEEPTGGKHRADVEEPPLVAGALGDVTDEVEEPVFAPIDDDEDDAVETQFGEGVERG